MVHINLRIRAVGTKMHCWKDTCIIMCRKHLQMAYLPSWSYEGRASILVEPFCGYSSGFIMFLLPQLVLINVNCL